MGTLTREERADNTPNSTPTRTPAPVAAGLLVVLLVAKRARMTGIAEEVAARDSVGRACAAPDTPALTGEELAEVQELYAQNFGL